LHFKSPLASRYQQSWLTAVTEIGLAIAFSGTHQQYGQIKPGTCRFNQMTLWASIAQHENSGVQQRFV